MPSSSSSSPNVNMSIFEKSKTSKKENDKRKYKKSNESSGEDSANDNGNDKSDSESSVRETKGQGKGRSSSKNKTNQKKHAIGGENNEGHEEFDVQEYRKMLADMFPSKYMSKRVENIDNAKERVVESVCKDLNVETQKKESRPSKNTESKKGKSSGAGAGSGAVSE
jgi:hypothetical protein